MKKAIGGQRLGSGNKMEVDLHNYGRSTHNLTKSFKSSLAPGVLYPCYVNVGLPGDTFDFDIKTFVRTLPTRGPLFGSFKMQVDMFVAPIRLYQGILHNNPLNIGLKMNQVYMPTIKFNVEQGFKKSLGQGKMALNSLPKYLGISGVGVNTSPMPQEREFNAVPFLAYYDVVKNYYANKQEENAYVICPNVTEPEISAIINNVLMPITEVGENVQNGTEWFIVTNEVDYEQDEENKYDINALILFTQEQDRDYEKTVAMAVRDGDIKLIANSTDQAGGNFYQGYRIVFLKAQNDMAMRYTQKVYKGIQLQPFKLENIDECRYSILSRNQLGQKYVLDQTAKYPYLANNEILLSAETINKFAGQYAMAGLCTKTYQSDIFNNWIQTEWIDGDNGISALSAVDVIDGQFTIDALNLKQKVYNMLNRIATAGGTFQDWGEAVYAEKMTRICETPMYIGGMSSEIVFEEVVSTAETKTEDETAALGSLGGKGREIGQKGGKVHVNIDEPSFIMAICSLTPRIEYSQGNKWYMTDLFSIDDLHKPALDGIGFQDLLVEQMAWWNTKIGMQGQLVRDTIGKQPAWINYMTDYDECFGDFAADEGKAFMVLNRNYEQDLETYTDVKDLTTYIDPAKFNYAFAYNDLTAQNFWAQIQFNVKARRKMSAKIIPNL